MINVHLRFYEELNDFLPAEKRKVCFNHAVAVRTSVKDVIESLNIPHTEVDLILVNGVSVSFSYLVQAEDYISVYPVYESLDISNVIRLRPKPLRRICFILDVHLGKLCKYLRLLGFDVSYSNDLADGVIIKHGIEEKRIILTRDIGILKHKQVTHGYWIRNTNPEKQIVEVLGRFDLYRQCHPFTRCLECNGILEKVEKHQITDQLLPLTQKYYENFMRCNFCERIYWEGTHYQKLKIMVKKFLPKDLLG